MVFLVPYDGSPVAAAALERAVEHGEAFEEEVVAVSLIPTGNEYAERRKWISPEEDFAAESARAALERKIDEATDVAERNYTDAGATAPQDGIADRLRKVAQEVDASTLYVGAVAGADGDGSVSTPFGGLTTNAAYDIHIVRTV